MMIKLLALGLALVVATPAHSTEPSPEDRTALVQLAQHMDQAWTMADANANAELFAIDATARFDTDPLGYGREAIRAQFRDFFTNRPAGLRHVTTIERVELLAPGVALWDAEVRVEREQPAGQWVTLTRIRNVTVAVRQSNAWRIQAVRAFPIR